MAAIIPKNKTAYITSAFAAFTCVQRYDHGTASDSTPQEAYQALKANRTARLVERSNSVHGVYKYFVHVNANLSYVLTRPQTAAAQ